MRSAAEAIVIEDGEAVEAPVAVAVTALAVRVQSLRNDGSVKEASTVADQLIRMIMPALATTARRYMPVAGTLELDDLLQVARTSAFKCIATFNAERSNNFGVWAMQHANRDVQWFVQGQAQDVNLSWRERGNTWRGDLKRERTDTKLQTVSRDMFDAQKDAEGTTKFRRALPNEIDFADPELLFGEAQSASHVREAVNQLPPALAKLVRMYFGLRSGTEPKSIHQIAKDTETPRAKLTLQLKEAFRQLREVLADMGEE